MGKYKQWLHHQEIGRRLRDQINTLEQERARVQKMAPTHPTSLPDLDNPIITALLSYTGSGNKLSNIDVIKAAMPALDSGPDQRRPASSASTTASSVAYVSASDAPWATPPSAENEAVVASLLARAEQMPSDPMEQMRELSHAREAAGPGVPSSGSAQSTSDSVSGWWNRQRDDD
ncbi:MAG TPA: hypothetical protein VFU63_08665 [Ktedonobacterales bacterium]|nr:hypothetical protein [Ktedonobacterales bacterium]